MAFPKPPHRSYKTPRVTPAASTSRSVGLRCNFLAHFWIAFTISALFILLLKWKSHPVWVARFSKCWWLKQKPPELGGSLTGSPKQLITQNFLYFQVLGGRKLLAAMVPSVLELVFLLTSVGKRPFGDILWKKYFCLDTADKNCCLD
jgi:hypothetical protein